MKLWHKILFNILIIVCYLISISFIAVYIFTELSSKVDLNPAERVILLLLSYIASSFGSILSCRIIGRNRAGKIMRFVIWFFFALYLLLILTLTEFDKIYNRNINNVFNWGSYTSQLYLKNSVNLVPFKTIVEYISGLITHSLPIRTIVINLLGNICAFMPFAFFLPLLFKYINSWKKFIIYMVLIALTIEVLQLVFMTGSCDIDDLILNVSGAWLMFEILQNNKIKKFIIKFTVQDPE